MFGLQQVTPPVVIVAAYGRKYSTKEAALKDWNAGKDFRVFDGPYCSIRDLPKLKASSPTVHLTLDHFRFIAV